MSVGISDHDLQFVSNVSQYPKSLTSHAPLLQTTWTTQARIGNHLAPLRRLEEPQIVSRSRVC